jgi:hypothetical protein
MAERTPQASAGVSRRQLIIAAGVAGVFGVTGKVAGQPVDAADDPVPAFWTLIENNRRLARFEELVRMQLAVALPSVEDIQTALTTGGTSRLPGKRLPPSVLLSRSTDVAPLRTWIETLQTKGAARARKTLLLVARDANGVLLSRFRLRNALPARIAVSGIEEDQAGTTVDKGLFVCTRIEIV